MISTKSGNRFSKDPTDWQWLFPIVPGRLRQLYEVEQYKIIIFSNQGGLGAHKNSKSPKMDNKRNSDFKAKVNAILANLDIPVSLYAASGTDHFRKPGTGMWKEMLDDYDMSAAITEGVDMEQSFYIGDAAGRIKDLQKNQDFACSDRYRIVNELI